MMRNFWKRKGVKIAAAALALIVAFFVRSILEQKEEKKEVAVKETTRKTEYAESVDKDNSILKVFAEKYSNAEVILACQEDVTDDGNLDLVVIYEEEDLIRTVVLVDSGDHSTYEFSEPIPAPRENQKIQFKNIDKEGQIEMIITGEKKGAVGYAIYRMIDGNPVDLFGEGMEDCC